MRKVWCDKVQRWVWANLRQKDPKNPVYRCTVCESTSHKVMV